MRNKWKVLLGALLAILVPSLVMAAAQVSTVNPTIPAQNSPLLSSVIRNNFAAAYNDITQLFAQMYGNANYVLGSTTTGTAQALALPSCYTGTSALTYQPGVGFNCNNSVGGGITALTQDVIASGTGSVAAVLANTGQARTDIGLGVASTPTFTGLTLSGLSNGIVRSTSGLLSGGPLTGADLPVPGASSLGGVQLLNSSAHQFVVSLSNLGVLGTAQPAAADVSGLAASATTDTTNASNISSGSLANARLTSLSANQVLGAATATTPSGLNLPSCSGATNALGWQSGTGFICNTIASGSNPPLNTITPAVASNTIDNGSNAQEWDWNSLLTGSAFKNTTTSCTTCFVHDVEIINPASTGRAGYFSNTGTGVAYGVYGSESGTSNTGYGVYGANSSLNATQTGGYGVFSSGELGATTSATGQNQPVFNFINNGNVSVQELGQMLSPNLGTGNSTYVELGVANSTKNSFGLGFKSQGAASNNSFGYMNIFGGGGFFVYANNNVLISSATNATAPSTAPTDQLTVAGAIALSTTAASVTFPGIYSPSAGNLSLTTTGAGDVVIPNVTTGALLCLTAGGALGHCTAAASCTSTCTCTCTAN